ncbi:Putative heterokaryon incompatibility [Septoria linicola]|uniref:Heterokaryon incompatibility n=1 Tax=Septoria linicola TaxID=215465 RepID=A0A9Q9EQC3_9PEZI|nr:putative heterokaryon incompatibility [Septoria linicola]USW57393.1 Putative heterokaryon incompatibility [Septoria linicola]
MAYSYTPLAEHEIRLITLQPTIDGADDSPIVCTLEHFGLADSSGTAQSPQHRSDTGAIHRWPELEADLGYDGVFKQEGPVHRWKRMQLLIETLKNDTQRDSRKRSGCQVEQHDSAPTRYLFGDYIALSYVWGSQDKRHAITLNGASFSVGRNLYCALIQLRRTTRIRQGFKLWVDAICINQNDIRERSEQVTRMRLIYTSAWQVVSWLGEACTYSDLAMRTIRFLAAIRSGEDPARGLYFETRRILVLPIFVKYARYIRLLEQAAFKALFELMARPYWTRMWIVQEVALASTSSPVYCGGICVSWSEICDAAALIDLDRDRLGHDIMANAFPRNLRMSPREYELARDRMTMDRALSTERMWRRVVELRDLQASISRPRVVNGSLQPLLLSREAGCTDEKDRVYGIIGCLGVDVGLVPDYTLDLATVYTRFMLALLQQGDLDSLRLISRPAGSIRSVTRFHETASSTARQRQPVEHMRRATLKVGADCTHKVPSWVICWTCKQPPTMHLPGTYSAGGPLASRPNMLSNQLALSCVLIDTIASLGSFHAEELDRAYPQNSVIVRQSVYGDFKATREALWKVVLADTTPAGGTAPESSLETLRGRGLWHYVMHNVVSTNGFALRDMRKRNGHLHLCGYTLDELVHESVNGNVIPTGYNMVTAGTNTMGRMGLTPAAARVGDRIAIVLGCSVPMVVRPKADNNGYALIGECFIQGVMYGEVLQAEHEVETIVFS